MFGLPCRGFLRVCCDFNGKLDRLLEGVTCPLVDWLDGLDVNVGDNKTVSVELEASLDLHVLIKPEHGGSDNPGGVLKRSR